MIDGKKFFDQPFKSKQQVSDADPKAIKQINFTGNLDQDNVATNLQNCKMAKLSNLQLNKLKSEIKNGTEVTLTLSTNVVGDSNDEEVFPRKTAPKENCPTDKLHPIYFSPRIRNRSTLIDSCFLLFSFFVV